MKKFKSGDIIYNSIKAYPKVRFLVNSGSLSFNNTANQGNAVLFDFLRTPQPQQEITELDCLLLTENSDPLMTQNNNYIIVEQCAVNFILAEDGQVLLEETGAGLLID